MLTPGSQRQNCAAGHPDGVRDLVSEPRLPRINMSYNYMDCPRFMPYYYGAEYYLYLNMST